MPLLPLPPPQRPSQSATGSRLCVRRADKRQERAEPLEGVIDQLKEELKKEGLGQGAEAKQLRQDGQVPAPCQSRQDAPAVELS